MTHPRLSGRDRRALLVGALILAPALVFRLILVPFAEAVDQRRDRLAVQRGLLARELGLIARAEGHPAEFRDKGVVLLDMAPRIFDGAEPMLVVDEAERYLERLLALGPLRVDQLQGQIAQGGGVGVVRIRAEMKGRGDLEAVLGVLRALEQGPKVAHVERLSLRRVAPHEEATTGGHEALAYAMEVALFALAPDSHPSIGLEASASLGAAGGGR